MSEPAVARRQQNGPGGRCGTIDERHLLTRKSVDHFPLFFCCCNFPLIVRCLLDFPFAGHAKMAVRSIAVQSALFLPVAASGQRAPTDSSAHHAVPHGRRHLPLAITPFLRQQTGDSAKSATRECSVSVQVEAAICRKKNHISVFFSVSAIQ